MTQPGLPRQAQIRSGSRVAGLILTTLGVVLFVGGFIGFVVTGFLEVSGDADPFEQEGLPTPVYWFLGVFAGIICLAIGRPLLAAGFGGAALRYGAGEAMPVVKESLAYLQDDASGAAKTGPFCRACGVRNDAEARFCDACGQSLA